MFYHLIRTITIILISFILLTAQSTTTDQQSYSTPKMVKEQENFFELGNLYLGGQPDSSQVVWFAENGVTLVVNIRTEKEIIKFEKENPGIESILDNLDIEYISIPMGGDIGYSPDFVETFAKAYEANEGKTLLHCASGGRASHLWVAYMANYKNIPINEAVDIGKQMKVKLPFEDLLGYEVKIDKK